MFFFRQQWRVSNTSRADSSFLQMLLCSLAFCPFCMHSCFFLSLHSSSCIYQSFLASMISFFVGINMSAFLSLMCRVAFQASRQWPYLEPGFRCNQCHWHRSRGDSLQDNIFFSGHLLSFLVDVDCDLLGDFQIGTDAIVYHGPANKVSTTINLLAVPGDVPDTTPRALIFGRLWGLPVEPFAVILDNIYILQT